MNRIVKTVAALAIGTGALVSSWSMGSDAHAATVSRTDAAVQLCGYFPEFGTTLARVTRTEDRWGRLPELVARQGTDRQLALDASALDFRVDHHWRIAAATQAVYLACNPDA